MNIPDYAFNEGTLAYYRDLAEFDKTICGRERYALLADPLAHHYIGRVAVVKKAFPEKSVAQCLAACKDKSNWIGTINDVANYVCDKKNKVLAKKFFEEVDFREFTLGKIPEPTITEFLTRHGFRWVWFGKVLNGVFIPSGKDEPKNVYRVTIPYNGTTTFCVCANDSCSAYAKAKALANDGNFGDSVLSDERCFDFEGTVMEIKQ